MPRLLFLYSGPSRKTDTPLNCTSMRNELSYGEASFAYTKEVLGLRRTGTGIVGQDRALRALSGALRSDRSGYNIFICGDFGTGRLTALREEVKAVIGNPDFIMDVAYVYNPSDRLSPMTLVLRPGTGSRVRSFLGTLREEDYVRNLVSQAGMEEEPALRDYYTKLASCPFNERMTRPYLILDRSGCAQRPFIIETHPSPENLFGYSQDDEIVPGSYMKASGGFLVLFADEVLAEKGLWDELKRHMDSTSMAVRGSYVEDSLGKKSRLRPQTIALQTKVILLAGDELYDELEDKDADFLRLFKSAPQFDYRMQANSVNIAGCVSYLESEAAKCGRTIDDGALLELLRYSSWFAESREHLTSQLSILGDIVSEAGGCSGTITREDIRAVIREREYTISLGEDRINEEIVSGDLIVATDGFKIGIVNGLAVMDRGLASFGTPAVISATVAPGSEGIVNIEHEAGLSGEIHDKGILILEGYLRNAYATSFPLSIYAGICFEQNYSEIDGDSASSSELYALLSAIGEIPVRQDIAVTGSVNQMGLLQPVGGINEKITGFYHTCLKCGLTGRQGVIIPRQNIKSLVLPLEVEEAIRDGSFHIYAISTIEEGMEIMTGLPSGKRGARGLYPAGSFERKIEDRLRRLYESGKSS